MKIMQRDTRNFIALAIILGVFAVLVLGGCEFLDAFLADPDKVAGAIDTGKEVLEKIIPFPFNLIVPGAVSLFAALVMPKEKTP